jgi:hypothetical protein
MTAILAPLTLAILLMDAFTIMLMLMTAMHAPRTIAIPQLEQSTTMQSLVMTAIHAQPILVML